MASSLQCRARLLASSLQCRARLIRYSVGLDTSYSVGPDSWLARYSVGLDTSYSVGPGLQTTTRRQCRIDPAHPKLARWYMYHSNLVSYPAQFKTAWGGRNSLISARSSNLWVLQSNIHVISHASEWIISQLPHHPAISLDTSVANQECELYLCTRPFLLPQF